MRNWGYPLWVHCHWCGTSIKTVRNDLKHHFCKPACKMAHRRAYKKWVTHKRPAPAAARPKRVTHKKAK